MKVWTVANQKGGVGKTTTAASLAGLLASMGKRVVLLDMDPHGSLTSYFGYDPDTIAGSLYELFQQGGHISTDMAASLLRPTKEERLFFMPASIALATLDRQLGAKQGMGMVVAHALQSISDQFDFAIIDCPPVLGVLMVNALAACQHLIIPVQTEFLALKGLDRMIRTLSMIGRARKTPLPRTIVPTLFDRRTRASLQTLRTLREKYAEDVWTAMIPIDTQFREASKSGLTAPALSPQSRGVRAYAMLLKSILDASAQA